MGRLFSLLGACVLAAGILGSAQAAPGAPYPPSTKIINEKGPDLYVVGCAPLSTCTIILPAGESPNDQKPISVGDGARWKYDVAFAGGRWLVEVKPIVSQAPNVIQINTDKAIHVLRLTVVPFARTVTYAFPDPPAPEPGTPGGAPTPSPRPTPIVFLPTAYKIDGYADFRPLAVRTDGVDTYLDMWAGPYDMPTIEGVGPDGANYPLHVIREDTTRLKIVGAPGRFIMEAGPGKRDQRVTVWRTN